jgi:hypothetical protein
MNFRRWITALAVLALFAGLANAQILSSTAGTGPFQCTASVAVPPVLRAEGLTEQVGDIVLTCTGGAMNVPSGSTTILGSPIPTANVTVSFQTAVTSRLLSYASASPSAVTSPNTSEALLLIDEPGSGLQVAPNGLSPATTPTGVGPQAPQTLCTNGGPASYMGAGPGGCPQYVQQVGGDWVMSSTSATYSNPANVYAGVVAANQVTFFGVPILPPTSAAVSRVFRITNVRVNAAALGASGFTGTFQVSAAISISGSTSVPIYTPVQIAGFVQSGLSTSMQNLANGGFTAPTLNQCNNAGVVTGVGILRYSENFGTAFKTRVAPQSASSYSGGLTNYSGTTSTQNIPGAIYNSESGFIFPTLVGSGTALNSVAGLADYGTRLKAVFNNIPTGVRIFVSTTNIVNIAGTTPSLISAPAGTSSTSFAQLVISETATEGSWVPASAYTSPSGGVTQLIGYAELSVVANTASATWEVVNTNSSTNESLNFGVWTAYTANAAANTPPLGTATVNMSYAPVPDATSFTAAAGAAASGSLVLPRFADTSTAGNLLTIVQCTTNLLFPFITNQVGFDTGVALMNTTTDPWGTGNQAGTCSLYFYGNNVPAINPFVTPVIPSGNTSAPPGNWAFMASNIATNFEGYMIAICNFQLAHGYAFVSDLGAQKLAHGYLALILNNGVSKRTATEMLEN